MSMEIEWVQEHECDIAEAYMKIEDEAAHGVWTTKDGQEIPVEEMTTSHIKNTIAYIQRVDMVDMYAPWIEVFKKELDKRAYEEYQDEVRKEYEYLHWDIR